MSVQALNNIEQVDRKVLEMFTAGLDERDNKWSEVFREVTPTRLNEKFNIIKLDNDVTETTDGGAFTPSDIKEIGGKTVTQKIFKDSVNIGDFSEAFDNYGKIAQAAQEKGADYKYKMDQIAVDYLNNYDSSTGQYGFIVDGTTTKTSLGSATQPIGDTGGTQSNLTTGGWSKTQLNSARTKMKEQQRHNGNIAGYTPKTIVNPVELTQAVYEDIFSPAGPTTDRNKNFAAHQGLKQVEWDLLTSADNVFIFSPAAKKYFVYCIKQRPSVTRIRRQSTGNMEYQYKMMLAAGVVDYQGTQIITA